MKDALSIALAIPLAVAAPVIIMALLIPLAVLEVAKDVRWLRQSARLGSG